MSIVEIANCNDAKNRLSLYFDASAFKAGDLDKAAQLLDLLSGLEQRARFNKQLEGISKAIWEAYNTDEIKSKSNRFTAAIVKVGEKFGFACQDNVVFVGALSGAAFGNNLKNKVLWKDSFALDHGEFSHSYQWLVAGEALSWQVGTADLYKNLAEIRSTAPLFVIDNGRLAFRRAPLWEYLVDCTNYAAGKCSEANQKEAVGAYINAQLARFKAGDTVDPYFATEYLRKIHKNEFFQEDAKWKKEFDSADKRKMITNTIIGLVGQKSLDQTRLEATFFDGEIRKFDKQNAITEEFAKGGTFRSPNNVTYLVRNETKWFINSYQLHRSGRRPPFHLSEYPAANNADDAKLGKLGVRGRQGVTSLEDKFKVMQIPLQNADRQITNQTKHPTKNDMTSGMVGHVQDREHNLIKTPLPHATLQVGGRTETFRSTNPIEGTRHAQHVNYLAKPRFQEVAPNVYRGALDARGPNVKDQISVTYHEVPGKMYAGLTSSIALNK